MSAAQRSAWVDWEDIPITSEWWSEIQRGIEAADSFLFVIGALLRLGARGEGRRARGTSMLDEVREGIGYAMGTPRVRLALGVRLGVTEEFEEQWGRLRADDPQWAAYEVYAWLGAVQESLVQALA